jgi:hypothetical protein
VKYLAYFPMISDFFSLSTAIALFSKPFVVRIRIGLNVIAVDKCWNKLLSSVEQHFRGVEGGDTY